MPLDVEVPEQVPGLAVCKSGTGSVNRQCGKNIICECMYIVSNVEKTLSLYSVALSKRVH